MWAKFAYTVSDGKIYDIDHYNLAIIIPAGYPENLGGERYLYKGEKRIYGLTAFAENQSTLWETVIVKNYLNEKEL